MDLALQLTIIGSIIIPLTIGLWQIYLSYVQIKRVGGSKLHPSIKWLTKTRWIWLLTIASIALGVALATKLQDLYRGLSATFAILTLGLVIQWIQTSRAESIRLNILSDITSKYSRLTKGLKRVVHLLPIDFRVADWKIIHTIEDEGLDVLREELTIIPSGDPVYFYFKKYAITSDLGNSVIKVSAQNINDKTPLSVFEVEQISGHIYYVILLDPPSTITSPKRIEIICERLGIWNGLINNNEAEGSLQANHPSDFIHIELLAPRGKKWKGFHPAPFLGEVKIDSSGSMSRASWTLVNPQPRKYTYQIFLEN